MNVKKTTTLAPPKYIFDHENPFNGDVFNRRKLAQQLTNYLDRLKEGTVIAIDAPWGEGKSWFGRNWASELNANNYRVVYLDAFQQDFIDEPFLLIASEISNLLDEDKTKTQALKEGAAEVMGALMPLGTKVLLNFAGKLILGISDVSKEWEEAIQKAADDASDVTQKWLEKKVEKYNQEKESIENYKKSLTDFCTSQEKPVVFFIDELDRCKPTFAIKLIERIKHFFDVPNLIFVLLLNKSQLEVAIKGVYGEKTDASTYLGKFVHISFKLPKKATGIASHSDDNWNYLYKLTEHYTLENNNNLQLFIEGLTAFAPHMGLSFRDLEKAMALLACNGVNASTPYLAWPVVLKLKNEELFSDLLKNKITAHAQAVALLESIPETDRHHFWAKRYFIAFHAAESVGRENLTQEQANDLETYRPQGYNLSMRHWLKQLELLQLD